MRGARLLQMLMLLQNSGRMTSGRLAELLEFSQRTVLRDLDAMTEAGLPVIAFQGAGGGIELGFDYRSQLTALTGDEADALGLMLAEVPPALEVLGLGVSARRAAGKIIEAQSAPVRTRIAKIQDRFSIRSPALEEDDPRPAAMARAVRGRNIVILRSHGAAPCPIHPARLTCDGSDWIVTCAISESETPLADWGDLQISAKRF